MTKFSCSETSNLLNTRRGNTDSASEARILTQEEVDEQIKTYNAPLTKQLEDLTQLLQGMSSAYQTNLFPGEYQC